MPEQYLLSKLNRFGGEVDGFHSITPKPNASIRKYIKSIPRDKEKLRLFICHDGVNWLVGSFGLTKDILGNDHAYSYERPIGAGGVEEKGRRISFTHGYILNKGESIPSINELKSVLPKHLQDLLDRAHAGETDIVSNVSLTSSRASGSDWDRIATEYEAGERAGKLSIFDGEKHLKDIVVEEKKTSELSGTSPMDRRAFFKVAAVGLGLAVAGFAAWKLFEMMRKKEPEAGLKR